jgi:uncharacterized membrane protein HdeD (DUF308 family)
MLCRLGFLISGAEGARPGAIRADGGIIRLVAAHVRLTLFAGVVLLWHPIPGTVSLTLVLTAFFLAEGLFQIMAAISHRRDFPESWDGWS